MSKKINPDAFSTPFLVIKALRRDPYPTILPSNPANSQKDKIIIITGASIGLGEAASNGIVITSRNITAINKLAEELKTISPSTRILAMKTDILNEDDVNVYLWRSKRPLGEQLMFC